jgi:perosamine synthetase
MKIPVFKPSIKRRDMDNVLSCMVSDKLGPGELSNELAKMVSKHLEIAGGFTFATYHTAISICMDIVNLQEGENIIISALAPSVYIDVFEEKGISYLIADVDPDSGLIDPESIQKNLDKNIRAVIIHNTLGLVPDMEKLAEYEILIIEDISHSLGSRFNDEFSGSFGDFCIISLDMENIITAGQGGLLLTKDKKYIKEIKNINSIENYFLSDFNASLGLAQLKQLNYFIKMRNELSSLFSARLMQSRHKTLFQNNEKSENVPFSFPVLLETGMNEVQKYAFKKNISTYKAFTSSIISRIGDDDALFPNAKSLLLRCLLFPLYPMLGNRNAETISKVLVSLP